MRQIDRAIIEQEASIVIGSRPGTHPVHILLPEVVPPTGTRHTKPSYLDDLDDYEEEPEPAEEPPELSPEAEEQPVEEDEPEEPPPTATFTTTNTANSSANRSRRSKSKSVGVGSRKSRSRKPSAEAVLEAQAAPAEGQSPTINLDAGIPERPTTPHRPTVTVRLTLPPKPPTPPPELGGEELPPDAFDGDQGDPNQPYCTCRKPSEGTVRHIFLRFVMLYSDIDVN